MLTFVTATDDCQDKTRWKTLVEASEGIGHVEYRECVEILEEKKRKNIIHFSTYDDDDERIK